VVLDRGDLSQTSFDAGHRGTQRLAPELENRVERVRDRSDQATSPTWIAMMPPPVRT
jgi:hypothetical protein